MEKEKSVKKKTIRKITKKRLQNIALFYLQRFESSTENLRTVLKRRIDKYAFQVEDFDKEEAYGWVEEIIEEFEGYKYIDDERYAKIKVKSYVEAGKSPRYIKAKLRQKGIEEESIETILDEEEYDVFTAALKFAKKKRIGPYRLDEEEREEYRAKDLAKLAQAGFDYDVAIDVIEYMPEE